MKLTLVLACSGACVSGLAAAAGLETSDLETRVLSGELTPESAIIEYCKGETLDKTQDAFCSSPDEALQLLEQRLHFHRMDQS
ncbi:hypothetical protein [uncultured Hoeflea sp.]|uniref:hypothetical protein n=1 Tax=uncultured Hoeflea sp. TaxID=538666 RepID=UPI0030D6E259|tara:strand:+ start:2511 stop:2759 length:249 start_codon:yes stop_codon:yes gene_type:complete